MSRVFGPMRQIGVVVRDLDAALRHWTEALGVGPFFVLPNLSPDGFRYRGEPSAPPLMSIALGNSGDMQVELIQQHDDHPSAYRDFLEAGREGVQHVSAWLNPDDYDATRTRLLRGRSADSPGGQDTWKGGSFRLLRHRCFRGPLVRNSGFDPA